MSIWTQSWNPPLEVILVVPMSLLCSLVGVRLAGMEVSIFTQIGFVVLVGLASKNAILIVEAVSAKMGYERVHDFHVHCAEYIASADMSCLMHMKGVIDRLKLPIKVIHIAQVLNGGPQ